MTQPYPCCAEEGSRFSYPTRRTKRRWSELCDEQRLKAKADRQTDWAQAGARIASARSNAPSNPSGAPQNRSVLVHR